ncbi:MAG: substrate-binding domain-containing protein [Proteobacteria bacterium]|nr:substrate-binding domain-containing protein [Pseudomonadota bacterium]
MKNMSVFIVFVFLILGVAETVFADVLIIANKDVPDTTLSSDDVKKIFLGKNVQWSNNAHIIIVISKNEDIHKDFLKRYVKRTASQYKAYWRNMLFTGNGIEPRSFDSEEKLMEYVANTPGVVSYIDSGTVPVNVNTITVK